MVVVPTFAPAGVAAKVKGKPGEMACVVDPPLVGSLIAAGCKFAHPDFSLVILLAFSFLFFEDGVFGFGR